LHEKVKVDILEIPFVSPYVSERNKSAILESLRQNHLQGDGYFGNLASKELSELSGGGHVLLTPSCTHALEMACMLSGVGIGDEVIMPSFTFTSGATAVTQFGGTPVFVDISPTTGCIDATLIRDAITSKTKAISWVNYAGNVPDLDELDRISKEFGLILIEDNAHALGGEWKGKKLGSFGHFSTLSFHATKNFQCGEGGALVINDGKFIERAEIIREKGTNRKEFLSGNLQKYQWVDKGSSYLLAEVLSAQLYSQLTEFKEIQSNRVQAWDYYKDALSDTFGEQKLSILLPNATNVAHVFAVIADSGDQKREIIKVMSAQGIQIASHYQPLHSSIAGKKFSRGVGQFSSTLLFAENLFRLPLWSHSPYKYSEVVAKHLEELLRKYE
jgi:dTDP-4-amino-4,6-dideoxygalactose transaminase